MKIDPNDAATGVAIPGFTYNDGSYEMPQMKTLLTKRELFAAMMMQGMLASWSTQRLPSKRAISKIQELSVFAADALIAELNGPTL